MYLCGKIVNYFCGIDKLILNSKNLANRCPYKLFRVDSIFNVKQAKQQRSLIITD